MSHPLKNVSVQELEAAIAQALQGLVQQQGQEVGFSVSVKELCFDAMGQRVDVSLAAWPEPPAGAAGGLSF